jgi:hypothetical protein
MQTPTFKQLDLVEQKFHQVAAFLASGDALQLQAASGALHTLSVELAGLLQTAPEQAKAKAILRQRVSALAQKMLMLRDNLSRREAFNQQALQVVLPTAAKSTYSGGSSVYGSVARQARVHKYVAA